MRRMLFYTAVDKNYHQFVCPYTLTALTSNPDAAVEVLISDIDLFLNKYGKCVAMLQEAFRDRVNFRKLLPTYNANIARYIYSPHTEAEVAYITDADFLFTEDSENMCLKATSELERVRADYTAYMRDTKELSEQRPTGVMFVKKRFFERVGALTPEEIKKLYGQYAFSDEIFLGKLIEKVYGTIVKDFENNRRLYAFHLSLNRMPFKNFPQFKLSDFTALKEMVEKSKWELFFPWFGEEFKINFERYMVYGEEQMKCLS